MTENIKINRYVTKETYQQLFNKFLDQHGYMTKLVNKATNDLSGYLLRAEIPTENSDTKYVALTFIPNNKYNSTPTFLKSVGINKVITAGFRKIKNAIKSNTKLESDSLSNYFKAPAALSNDELKMFESENFSYNDFYNYILAFENKIKKYYKNQNVTLLVV